MSGSRRRNPDETRCPDAEDAHVPWTGDVNDVQTKLAQPGNGQVAVVGEQGITKEVGIQREGERAAAELELFQRTPRFVELTFQI